MLAVLLVQLRFSNGIAAARDGFSRCSTDVSALCGRLSVAGRLFADLLQVVTKPLELLCGRYGTV
jgi:hypothetical protein